jgi:hypothetical protein
MIGAASFRRTLFLTRVSKGTGRFLMRRLASLIYYVSKKNVNDIDVSTKYILIVDIYISVICFMEHME